MSDEKQEKMGALSFVFTCFKFILGNTPTSLVVFLFYFAIAASVVFINNFLGGGR